jgi:MFS family permease
MKKPDQSLTSSNALKFVVILGIVNLFADMTYEGARSVNGAFLQTLGASAAVVGFTAGFGELVGYAFRSVTGYISDKTGKYWLMTITGYVINMLAVPALALTGHWPIAAALMVTERTGRAIRKPSTEAMLSFASKHVGTGKTFGLVESLDQVGATVGPLIIALTLFLGHTYRVGYSFLLVPALLTIGIVFAAYFLFPNPHKRETGAPLAAKRFPKPYWIYMAAGACVAAGFADFSLIAYHFQKTGSVGTSLIPVFYAVAMAMGAVSAYVFGKVFDKIGTGMIVIAFALSAFFAPLVFLSKTWLALAGMLLWGIGLGAQDSLLKAIITPVISSAKRSTAFGLFDSGFGIAWFLGSWLMGVLYGRSISAVIVFSVVLQLSSLPLFLYARNQSAAVA